MLFAGHHFPTWESKNIIKFISEQRDLYAYLHDQTVRLINQGLNGVEIAQRITLPPSLARAWHTQGFYGSVSHNVKGIYQRYMTWFDGNPANLWKHTPAEEGKRYVECMGGLDAVISKALDFAVGGDLRFAATLLDHAVAAEPSNEEARAQLAGVYDRLGFGAENATWRNFYLTGAENLRKSTGTESSEATKTQTNRSLSSINPLSTIGDWLDALSVQLDGQRACDPQLTFLISIATPEDHTYWTLRLSNGTLTHNRLAPWPGECVDLTLTLRKSEIYQIVATGNVDIAKKKGEGNFDSLVIILDLCGIRTSTMVIGKRPTRL